MMSPREIEVDNLRAAARGAESEAARARSEAATLRAESARLRAALEQVRGNHLACIEATLDAFPVPSGNASLSRTILDVRAVAKDASITIRAALEQP